MVKGHLTGSALRGTIAAVCGVAFLVSLAYSIANSVIPRSFLHSLMIYCEASAVFSVKDTICIWQDDLTMAI